MYIAKSIRTLPAFERNCAQNIMRVNQFRNNRSIKLKEFNIEIALRDHNSSLKFYKNPFIADDGIYIENDGYHSLTSIMLLTIAEEYFIYDFNEYTITFITHFSKRSWSRSFVITNKDGVVVYVDNHCFDNMNYMDYKDPFVSYRSLCALARKLRNLSIKNNLDYSFIFDKQEVMIKVDDHIINVDRDDGFHRLQMDFDNKHMRTVDVINALLDE